MHTTTGISRPVLEAGELSVHKTRHRKHFGPRQVRTLKGIKKDRIYIECSEKYEQRRKVQTTSYPYYEHETWWVDVLRLDSGLIGPMSLADHNVVAYQDGMWNNVNFFIRS